MHSCLRLNVYMYSMYFFFGLMACLIVSIAYYAIYLFPINKDSNSLQQTHATYNG